MDRVFTDQIDTNVKVYVDEIVIKIRHKAALLGDIEETSRTLAQAQMKLNLGKCTFWLEECQFIGYQTTKEGIAPKQTKVQDFLDSMTPYKLKGVHEINGRLMALDRFIAKSAEKSIPLFHILKGCVDKHHFKWTSEVDKSLQYLKEALQQLSTMASPLPGESLKKYLTTSGEAIS